MAALEAAIQGSKVLGVFWMAGSSPAMTFEPKSGS
jgi:hypothetical protein